MYKFAEAFVLKEGKKKREREKDPLCVYLISGFNCSGERTAGDKENTVGRREI